MYYLHYYAGFVVLVPITLWPMEMQSPRVAYTTFWANFLVIHELVYLNGYMISILSPNFKIVLENQSGPNKIEWTE